MSTLRCPCNLDSVVKERCQQSDCKIHAGGVNKSAPLPVASVSPISFSSLLANLKCCGQPAKPLSDEPLVLSYHGGHYSVPLTPTQPPVTPLLIPEKSQCKSRYAYQARRDS